MIKAIYSFNGEMHTSDDAEEIAKIYAQKPKFIWADIFLENHELTIEETDLLSKTFQFHEMSLEDCLFPQYYPKVEEIGNYIFGAIHGIQLKPNYFQEFDESIYELNFFAGKGFLVTAHIDELFFLELLFEKTKTLRQTKNIEIEKLLYGIFNKTVSSYEFTLEKIDEKIELLEDEILASPDPKNMEQILDTKKVIFALKKIAEAQQAVYVYFIRADIGLIRKEYLVYFRDISSQIARLNQSIMLRSQTVVSLLEVYMSSVTVKLTEVMKVLTVIATVLMPVLVISGYYGMNVVFPEYAFFSEKGTWYFAVSLMICAIVLLLLYFKRKKWF
ncbi:MAG: magnesium transporter CorA family protein [Elusimicrobiota bacterium]|jgi:magnesium transporter|nr:magnesium transporter CorA family protein [Elusimicrobiota bacterium]